jgi:kinesin family protein 2/24
LTLAL